MADEIRIALLIDAENISAQYAGDIIEEVEKYGICSYKRIYGNWERIVKTRWEQEIRRHSLKPMMQVNNTRGKNASDSALIIDAMDILYTSNVEGFCIVSSDSDFTFLARRLSESGCVVLGMGESDKATEALENAYDRFIYIDLLAKQAEEERAEERAEEVRESDELAGKKQQRKPEKSGDENIGKTPSKKAIEARIKQIIMENNDKGKPTSLGQIGNELSRIYKNFDVRYYSMKGGKRYKYLKEFVGDLKSLTLTSKGERGIYVSIK